jgi:hypothetical protein
VLALAPRCLRLAVLRVRARLVCALHREAARSISGGSWLSRIRNSSCSSISSDSHRSSGAVSSTDGSTLTDTVSRVVSFAPSDTSSGPPPLNLDAPYPIWMFDPQGPYYSFFLSVARTFAGILENVHDVTGLPWWGTVVAGSLLVRIVYFPVNCYALRNASRFFDAQSDIQSLQRSHRAALATLVCEGLWFDACWGELSKIREVSGASMCCVVLCRVLRRLLTKSFT